MFSVTYWMWSTSNYLFDEEQMNFLNLWSYSSRKCDTSHIVPPFTNILPSLKSTRKFQIRFNNQLLTLIAVCNEETTSSDQTRTRTNEVSKRHFELNTTDFLTATVSYVIPTSNSGAFLMQLMPHWRLPFHFARTKNWEWTVNQLPCFCSMWQRRIEDTSGFSSMGLSGELSACKCRGAFLCWASATGSTQCRERDWNVSTFQTQKAHELRARITKAAIFSTILSQRAHRATLILTPSQALDVWKGE